MGVRVNAVWTTRDGRRIKVQDLTDAHLQAILLFIDRRDPWHMAFAVIDCDTCPYNGGDGTTIDELVEGPRIDLLRRCFPAYDALIAEAEHRRGGVVVPASLPRSS